MSNPSDTEGDVSRRPRLVLPGAEAGPVRPKIILPGVGLVDPNATAPPEEVQVAIPEGIAYEEAVYADPAEIAATTTGGEVEETPAYEATETPPLESYAGSEMEGHVDYVESAEAIGAGADDFLSYQGDAPEPEAGPGRPPEIRAAPAELKGLAPQRLGPPAGWQMIEEVPPMEVTPVAPEMVWDEPLEDVPVEVQYQEQAEEADAPVPMAIPMRPLSSRVPTPLTSPHSDRPATRRITQQVRATTGMTTRHHAAALARPGQGTAPHSLHGLPGLHAPIPLAKQRLIPSWVLVVIGVLLGAIGALVAVAKSPLRDKLGLIDRGDSNAYVLAVLKEERSQVQAMLDEYHRNAKVILSEDMSEFRAEMGRKAPEKMTMQEFAVEIKEEAAIKKIEEEEDKKAAEEEAKAKEEEANPAEEGKKE